MHRFLYKKLKFPIINKTVIFGDFSHVNLDETSYDTICIVWRIILLHLLVMLWSKLSV